MLSIFDNNSLQYMLEQFPRTIIPELWRVFENGCKDGTIISERETRKKLENEALDIKTLEWCKDNTPLFKAINEKESSLLGELMENNVFDVFNNPNLFERRLPEGIPFILCMAKIQNRIYVFRKNTDVLASIKKICDNNKIEYIEVEEYLLKLKKRTKKNEV